MNTRSLRFRLSVWYAVWMTVMFVIFGMFLYVGLTHYLERDLAELLSRRAIRVAELLQRHKGDWNLAGSQISDLFAPEANSRFVRITVNERVIYNSGKPVEGYFDPEDVAAATPVGNPAGLQRRRLPDDSIVLVEVARITIRGDPVVVEFGTSREPVESTLREWMTIAAIGLGVMLPVAILGGFVLVQRALRPVDRMIATAAQISSRNLSDRLPVPSTRDELERLATALNSMIKRLDDSFRYTQRFLADASHELRTPMTIVEAELQTIIEKATHAEVREFAGSALEEVERLKSIVEALFALARLDAGEAQREAVPVDLSELVTTTADQMSLLAQDKNIGIINHCEAPVMVRGDRGRLKQIAVNLLDNAIKYTHDGGKIEVRVSSCDREAMLEISDTGIGIPNEALPHVFERFYRADKARSREQGGAGLGLAIVRAICEAHNGRVDVQSVEGQGARFVVALPLIVDESRK